MLLTIVSTFLGMPDVRLIKALKEIAHFHATTYHYIRQYPGGMEVFKEENPDMFLRSLYDIYDENLRKTKFDTHCNFLKNAGKVIYSELVVLVFVVIKLISPNI